MLDCLLLCTWKALCFSGRLLTRSSVWTTRAAMRYHENLVSTRSVTLFLFLIGLAIASPANSQGFVASLESFSATGNITGDLFDSFDDGDITQNWIATASPVGESGGTMTLGPPATDFIWTTQLPSPGWDLAQKHSQVQLNPALGVAARDGFGDFQLELRVEQFAPNPGEFVSLNFGFGGQQAISIAYINRPAQLAAEINSAPGVGFESANIAVITSAPGVELTSSAVIFQQEPVQSGSVSGDIVLRINYDDTLKLFRTFASKDGGNTFSQISTSFPNNFGWFGGWSITAGVDEVPPVVPFFSPPVAMLLVSALILFGLVQVSHSRT